MAAMSISAEERNARVSALLRQVDEEVKAKRFEQALEKVRRVYEFDIKNIYARAYEERILVMKVEQEREDAMKEVEKRAAEKADEELQRRLKDFYRQQEAQNLKRRQLEQQEQDLEARARRASVNEVQQVAVNDISAVESGALRRIEELERKFTAQLSALSVPPAPAAGASGASDQIKATYEAKIRALQEQFASSEAEQKKVYEEAFQKLKEDQQRLQEDLAVQSEEERKSALQNAAAKEKDRMMEAYRSVMSVMMHLNLPPETQAPILQSLKISSGISDTDHMEIERAVQVNAYIEVLRNTWQQGPPSEADRAMLANLQQLYRIPDEEHALIAKRVKHDLGLPDETAVIFVIDDDLSIRKYASHVLKKTYATVVAAASAEEALQFLAGTPPSLILSDINLGAGAMSGFTFYEKILAGTYGEPLKSVPFILMSAMEDEFFLRSARQLGVKAFLSKPFTREALEETIRKVLA